MPLKSFNNVKCQNVNVEEDEKEKKHLSSYFLCIRNELISRFVYKRKDVFTIINTCIRKRIIPRLFCVYVEGRKIVFNSTLFNAKNRIL